MAFMTISHGDSILSPLTPTHKRRVRKVALLRMRRRLMLRPKVWSTIGFGALSVALYYALYLFNDDLKHIAEATNRGDKALFLLPIVLAFVFSLVHGLFTDRFWEAVGLKAKR